MIKKLKNLLDPKYAKICIYAGVSALIVFALGLLLFHVQGFFLRLWSLITAVMKPLIYGALLSYLVTPLVRFFEHRLSVFPFMRKKKNRARRPAIVITLLLVTASLTFLVILFASIIYRGVDRIDFSTFELYVDSVRDQFTDFTEMLQNKLSEYGFSIGGVGKGVGTIVGGISSFFTTALFSIIFSIYFLLDKDHIAGYWQRALRLVGGEKVYTASMRILDEADSVFSGYIRGQFIDASIVCILISITMLIARIPYAIVVGVLTGIGNLIPYVGGVTGVLAVTFSCVAAGSLRQLVAGYICLAVVMFVDANIINPRLLGNNIEIHPLLVVAALIAGSAVGGFAGMLVAVPLAALLKLEFDRYLDSIKEDGASAETAVPEDGQLPSAAEPSRENAFPSGKASGQENKADQARSKGPGSKPARRKTGKRR